MTRRSIQRKSRKTIKRKQKSIKRRGHKGSLKRGGTRYNPTDSVARSSRSRTTTANAIANENTRIKSAALSRSFVPTPKLSRSSEATFQPMVNITEDEDILEAHLALLQGFMGGSACETFIEYINQQYGTNIEVKLVGNPQKPSPQKMVPGQPAIFYGKDIGTHFTCTVDGMNIIDSYQNGTQMNATDHFCQTFAMMALLNGLGIPEWGQDYFKIQPEHFMSNAFFAKQFACKVLFKLFNDNPTPFPDFIESQKPDKKNKNFKGHSFVANFNIPNFLQYCQAITLEEMCNSSFKKKVYLCEDDDMDNLCSSVVCN